jgi:hypothetical protein
VDASSQVSTTATALHSTVSSGSGVQSATSSLHEIARLSAHLTSMTRGADFVNNDSSGSDVDDELLALLQTLPVTRQSKIIRAAKAYRRNRAMVELRRRACQNAVVEATVSNLELQVALQRGRSALPSESLEREPSGDSLLVRLEEQLQEQENDDASMTAERLNLIGLTNKGRDPGSESDVSPVGKWRMAINYISENGLSIDSSDGIVGFDDGGDSRDDTLCASRLGLIGLSEAVGLGAITSDAGPPSAHSLQSLSQEQSELTAMRLMLRQRREEGFRCTE